MDIVELLMKQFGLTREMATAYAKSISVPDPKQKALDDKIAADTRYNFLMGQQALVERRDRILAQNSTERSKQAELVARRDGILNGLGLGALANRGGIQGAPYPAGVAPLTTPIIQEPFSFSTDGHRSIQPDNGYAAQQAQGKKDDENYMYIPTQRPLKPGKGKKINTKGEEPSFAGRTGNEDY